MKTLILLPGTMCDARVFAPQAAHFSDGGWDVQIPAVTGHPGGICARAEDMLAKLPPRFALAGLSLGGVVALEMMRLQPERITHAVLLDTNDGADNDTARARREDDFRRARDIGLEKFMVEEMIPRYLHARNRNDENLARVIAAMAADAGAEVWRGQMDLLPGRRDNREVLKAARMPVLVGCGEADALCPPQLHRQMAAAARTTARIFKGSGHLPVLENPREVTAAMAEFLA